MPELPEVEVTKLGIAPFLEGSTISKIVVHQPQLRWIVPDEVQLACQQKINSVSRRAKYLFINTDVGALVMHLGMSGKMRVVDISLPRQKHDHIEIELDTGKKLVFNDARRFGSCLWQAPSEPPLKILRSLGPEPLSDEFDAKVLFTKSRGKLSPVKSFIMDNAVVVGVGNIYANESLFKSGIDPRRAAGKVSLKRYERLTENIKEVLAEAIKQGGTTLKDFAQADGSPGYFAQKLLVYGRKGDKCELCQTPIRSIVIGQRNTFYCITCQK
jgi:formamidopyrimidine-DNA glycosylase